jgi:hypothetical protein
MPARSSLGASREGSSFVSGDSVNIAARLEQAPRFLLPKTYLEPFALRALGIVRDDRALIDQALERFRTLELDWHAAQTEALINP